MSTYAQQIRDDDRRTICAWLKANGINPDTIPVDASVADIHLDHAVIDTYQLNAWRQNDANKIARAIARHANAAAKEADA